MDRPALELRQGTPEFTNFDSRMIYPKFSNSPFIILVHQGDKEKPYSQYCFKTHMLRLWEESQTNQDLEILKFYT